jgi:multidrug resistance efflux pump
MFELILCSLLTIFPDYLFRRYVQGKRIGKEITLYSVWFELRWGIFTCLLLTIALITTVFYNHPSTHNVTSIFRTVPIVPETIGRVAQVHIDGISGEVKKGEPIFTLDNSKQRAALETAKRQSAEIDAAMVMAKADIAAAEGQLVQAKSAYQQALDELQTKQELNKRNADIVARREIEKLQVVVDQRQGGIDAAQAAKQAAETKLSTLLPAQKASAEAALAQAQVDLDKTVVRAGVSGRVEQFALKVGDVVNPMARSAGILIPEGSGQHTLLAGFGQTEAQVLRTGMVAEAVCSSKPWAVIPMVVTQVQDYIAAGQFRGGEQLLDVRQTSQPGTILVVLEPLFEGGLDDVTPGSSCIANAYTSHHEQLLASPDASTLQRTTWHVIDGVGLVHALILRIQALLMPIQDLVFKGHG